MFLPLLGHPPAATQSCLVLLLLSPPLLGHPTGWPGRSFILLFSSLSLGHPTGWPAIFSPSPSSWDTRRVGWGLYPLFLFFLLFSLFLEYPLRYMWLFLLSLFYWDALPGWIPFFFSFLPCSLLFCSCLSTNFANPNHELTLQTLTMYLNTLLSTYLAIPRPLYLLNLLSHCSFWYTYFTLPLCCLAHPVLFSPTIFSYPIYLSFSSFFYFPSYLFLFSNFPYFKKKYSFFYELLAVPGLCYMWSRPASRFVFFPTP